jgi:sugar/nucleoside kinase (ribokinase family)
MSVAAIGALNIDLIYSGRDRLPGPGEEIYYPAFDLQLGGGPALLPIALRHLRVKARLGTFLSHDLPSRMARSLVQDLGFRNLINLRRKGEGSPVIVTSAVSLKHDRCFLSHGGSDSVAALSARTVYEFLRGSKICFALPLHFRVMQKLRREGTLVVFDSGWTDQMRLADHADILRSVDVYTPNDKEAMRLTRTKSPERAIRVLGKYVPHPVITLGREGCLTLLDGEAIRVPMPCRFEPVDTTGAGDNFLAGVVYGLSRDWPFLDCLKMGNICGGISTTALGCYRGLRSWSREGLLGLMKCYRA